MIVRCHHLREVGIIDGNCCFHCHILAGCVGQNLPNEHEAIYCCAYAKQLTDEDISIILAKIPEWQKLESLINPAEHESHISSTTSVIPERFRPAYQAIQRLESNEYCLAALIVGSVARGDTTQHSNMYVIVIVNKSPSYRRRHYLTIGGVKLDLGFLSLEIFEKTIYKEIEQHERDWHLTVADCLIVFDKHNKLRSMQEKARSLQRPTVSPSSLYDIQSTILIYNDMLEDNLQTDPSKSLLLMHIYLQKVLMFHYQLQRRWWHGHHLLLADLRHWDHELAYMVENFTAISDVQMKFQQWSAIIDHILQPCGGRQIIMQKNNYSDDYQQDLALFLAK